LHSLGKKQAISLLLEIASIETGGTIITDANGEAIDARQRERSPHDQTVCTIVPLLFEIPEKGTSPPDAWYSKRHRCWGGAAGTRVVEGGIPFAITGAWTYGGYPYGTRPLVEWAEKHGKLRATQLDPQNDPLQAADALHDRIEAGGVSEFEELWQHIGKSSRDGIVSFLQEDLRAQAIGMLPKQMRDLADAASWDSLRLRVKDAGLCWDGESYVECATQNVPNKAGE
jgi:hypothetical protein